MQQLFGIFVDFIARAPLNGFGPKLIKYLVQFGDELVTFSRSWDQRLRSKDHRNFG